MNTDRRAIAALTAAGLLWGTTVPLSKLALEWLAPGWLAVARFGLAAAILLVAASRRELRTACTPLVLGSGAAGYGGSVVLQNAGITRTSVTHAALLIGATPVLVAVVSVFWHRVVARPAAWAGFAMSLAGVGLVAGGRGGGATAAGDGLVLASLLLSATFTAGQARLLRGRDPVAVTAVQFLGAALAALPFSAATEGMPCAPGSAGAALAAAALVAGTLLPFTLFAYGQSRVSPEVAGAFLNLEPLVGSAAGVVIFGDPAGPAQAVGGAAIIAGIALSSLPLLVPGRRASGALAGCSRRFAWRMCRSPSGRRPVEQKLDGPRGAVDIAGGEQVEHRPAQQGEDGGALRGAVAVAAARGRLAAGQQAEPVPHRLRREPSPRPGGVDQRPGVGFHPQAEQVAMAGGGEPLPDPPSRVGQVSRFIFFPERLDSGQLFAASPVEQCPDQIVLRAVEEQQHPRAGADRLGQRTQRHTRQPVVQHVPVGQLEQLVLPLRRHPAGVGGRRRHRGAPAAALCPVSRSSW